MAAKAVAGFAIANFTTDSGSYNYSEDLYPRKK